MQGIRFEIAGSPARDCSDIGKNSVLDLAECRKAKSELKIKNFLAGTWFGLPKGCSKNGNGVYWNTHETGAKDNKYFPICRKEGNHNNFSSNYFKWILHIFSVSIVSYDIIIVVKYLSLDAEYSLISTNKLCSDEGMTSLGNIDDCKKALIVLNIQKTPIEDTGKYRGDYPKGCYQHMMGSYQVYFNKHVNGSRQKDSAPICNNG